MNIYDIRWVTDEWNENGDPVKHHFERSLEPVDTAVQFDMETFFRLAEENAGRAPSVAEEISFWRDGGPDGNWQIVWSDEGDGFSLLYSERILPGGKDCCLLALYDEPRTRSHLLGEEISALELYGDTVVYTKNGEEYKMNVYSGTEEGCSDEELRLLRSGGR